MVGAMGTVGTVGMVGTVRGVRWVRYGVVWWGRVRVQWVGSRGMVGDTYPYTHRTPRTRKRIAKHDRGGTVACTVFSLRTPRNVSPVPSVPYSPS